MNQLNELIAIATIFFGILLLLVAFILSAGVFLFDFESLPFSNSGSIFGSYAFPVGMGILGYLLFGTGFGQFLKQRRNCVYPLFFIIFTLSMVLLLYLSVIFSIKN